MYLKNLELVGFKSFPEKSQFLFNKGITSIVGPNGCGKSNLLDALRWVLGEQRTSLLRGTKMEEVIFAGTRTLKPLGMAEVSLNIDNKDGSLPSQYGELTVSRRLYRSGESEYLINKVPCRLKDITDLFADSGVGAHAYAIIQQEMVDAILSDKNEERRFLFEEAAGITRYKQRKKAAERKLEATEHDLLRLQDILSEVTTRVRSLKRQVNKAERYKTVSEELKSWDLFNARTRYDDFTQSKKELAIKSKSLDDQKIAIEAQLNSKFAELEKSRTLLTEIDGELSELGSRVYDLSEKAHEMETRISVNREKKENLSHSAEQNREEIVALTKRAEVIREEKAKAEEEVNRLNDEIAAMSSKLYDAVNRQKLADEEFLRFRSATENENAKLYDLEGRLSSGRTDSANIEEQLSDLQSETDIQNKRKSNLIEEKNKRRGAISLLQSQIDTARSEVESGDKSLSEKEIALENSISHLDQLKDQQTEVSSSFEATLARKNLLSEMIEHYEGYGSGVVAIFDVASRWVDVTGTVADFVRPVKGLQTAIEAALGEAAQYIICSNTETAHQAVSYLREQKAGRATFLILEKLAETINRPELPQIDGLMGWADELVECDERYARVPKTLLGRTVICENNNCAQQVLSQMPDGYRVATVNGDLFSRDGIITGGASEDISLIGRKNEVETLEGKINELNNRANSIREKQAQTNLSIGELRQSIIKTKEKLEEDKNSLSDLTSGLKEEQFKINAADEVITSIEQNLDQITQKLERLKHRQYTLALDFDQLDKEKENLATLVQDKKTRLTELEEAVQLSSNDVNRLNVENIEKDSKRSHAVSQVEYYDEMLKDIDANTTQKEHYIEEAEKSTAELSELLIDDEKQLKEIFDERQRETEVQQVTRNRRDETTGSVNGLDDSIKALRKERDDIGEEAHTADIKETEVNSRIEQLEERILGEHHIHIHELEIESPNSEITAEQAEEHVDELRGNIRKMGIVNLLALEEYDEQKQRQEFLSKQLDDLITAKSTLKSTIQKINQTAKAMFLETINKARDNFKQMYQELFTGGEADIILEDESDPLESRIEIVSRPRGKKPLTITQLSGGERALTAISLLFALYMVKPSPFCFLDEIDAPLDDVNVGRFLKIVRTFARQTQFVIITHNKITMEAADTLYGVTMEEPGVSKVVAVRFKKEAETDDTILDLHYSRETQLAQETDNQQEQQAG
ncbi:MAG: chromosome segregation protein SMC [candidate division Zixibacteria bacterium]|nr:chromosome segregation protein SMC [candidate division Zixibacteria bacterium]